MSLINLIRMAPANASAGTVTAIVSGRRYQCAVGSTIDVPEFDAGPLEGQNFIRICPSGPTSQRPAYPPNANSDARIAAPPLNYEYLDTTVSKVIRHNGSVWIDPVTGAVV